MGRQQGQIRLCMRSEGVIDRMTDIQVEDKVPRMWNKCKRIFFGIREDTRVRMS